MPTRGPDEAQETFVARCVADADVRAVSARQAGADADPEEINRIASAICFNRLEESSEAEVLAPEHREHGMQLAGVEIFRVGTWNGDKYTARDLDDMVTAFAEVGYRPPVKLGHSDQVGEPAYGWVESIRRVGDKLIATFSDLPETIHQAIVERRYDAVSSEIFFNLKRGERKFRRALKAVALLGAEIPGVAGLAPLRDAFADDFAGLSVKTYTLKSGEKEMPEDDAVDVKALQDQLDAAQAEVKTLSEARVAVEAEAAAAVKAAEQRAADAVDAPDPLEVKRLQEQVSALTASMGEAKEAARQTAIDAKVKDLRIPALREHVAALYDLATVDETKTVRFTIDEKRVDVSPVKVIDDLVARINKQSERLFAELGTAGNLKRDDQPREEDAGEEINRLVMSHLGKNAGTTYSQALQAVTADPENVDIVRAYAARKEG